MGRVGASIKITLACFGLHEKRHWGRKVLTIPAEMQDGVVRRASEACSRCNAVVMRDLGGLWAVRCTAGGDAEVCCAGRRRYADAGVNRLDRGAPGNAAPGNGERRRRGGRVGRWWWERWAMGDERAARVVVVSAVMLFCEGAFASC